MKLEQTIPILTLVLFNLTLAAVITGPTDKMYERGLQTQGLVECIVDIPNDGEVFVSKENGGVIAINGRPYDTTAYAVSSDAPQTGNYSLTILNLKREDSGTYTCQNDRSQKSGTITVADRPGEPQITAPSTTLTENTRVTFTCVSSGGYPAPTFLWTMRGEAITESSYTASDDGGESRSEVVLSLTHNEDQQDLQCQVIHPLVNKSSSIQLNVLYKPRISVSLTGGGSVVERGVSFSLRCNILANPSYQRIQWIRDGRTITDATSDTYTDTAGIAQDSVYGCIVTNSEGQSEASTNLTVQYPPVVTIVQGTDLTKNEGERLVLTCHADGVPTVITYRWVKENSVQTTNNELVITSLGRSHSGVYTCIATNSPLGVDASRNNSITVSVNYAPSVPDITVRPNNEDGVWKASTRVVFSCSLPTEGLGSPAANYSWLKGSTEISTSQNLVIESAVMNDTGSYVCKVSNIVTTQTSKSLDVTIHDVPELLATSPNNVTITDHNRAYALNCTFRGMPTPQITWYFNGEPITAGPMFTIDNTRSQSGLFQHVTSFLKFEGTLREKITVEDLGLYSCQAESDVGIAAQSGEFSVDVQFQPKIIGFKKSAADIGSRVVVTCEVHSNPPVTSVSISRGSQAIVESPTVIVGELETDVGGMVYHQRKSVTINPVSESSYGNYDCRVESTLGVADAVIKLQRTGKPDAPTGLSLKTSRWDSVDVSWVAGFDGGKAQSFIVMVDNKSFPPTDNTSMLLNGLYASQKYKVQLKAKNIHGETLSADTQTITTDAFTVPEPSIQVNKEEYTLTVKINSSEYCVIVMGSNDNQEYKELYDGDCNTVNRSRVFILNPNKLYSYYKAMACVIGRESDVCSYSENMIPQMNTLNEALNTAQSEKLEKGRDDMMWIIIGAVSGGVVIIIIIIIAAVILTRKRKTSKDSESAGKSVSPTLNNGYINHVIGEPHTDEPEIPAYSTYTPQNNNLDRNTLDSRKGLVNAEAPRDSQNFEYVYAAVQKKSAVQNKAVVPAGNNYTSFGHPHIDGGGFGHPHHIESGHEHYEMQPSPAESNSDNTEEDTLDDLPTDISAIIGSHPPTFHRHPSVSESGYSTPDSKALKRVIYEVIV